MPIKVNLDVVSALHTRRFSDDIEGAAYFFVSEALTNVLKHSNSHNVDVRLAICGDELLVEVADSGVGFAPDVGWGSGLRGLFDRIHALGGDMTLDNRPDQGVRLIATLPIPSLEAT